MKYIGRIPILALGKHFLSLTHLKCEILRLNNTHVILIIFSGTIVHGSIVIVMLFWRPHPESPLVFFAIAGLWGVGDAVWQTQINGRFSPCSQ